MLDGVEGRGWLTALGLEVDDVVSDGRVGGRRRRPRDRR